MLSNHGGVQSACLKVFRYSCQAWHQYICNFCGAITKQHDQLEELLEHLRTPQRLKIPEKGIED